MRAIVIAIVLTTAANAVADPAGDEKGTFGIGLVVGEPTGICAKLYLKDDQAIQGAVGSAFVGGGIQVHADYVFHPWILEERESFTLPVYLGPGVRVIDYDKGRGGNSYLAAGLRVVGGLMFDFRNVPLDAFVEVAGVGEYGFSSTEGGFGLALNAGAGVRYYF
ncbi:MAG TPA: hypothetical protein VL463_11335 [Kofleriaceae bacterium]|jgi:hypothetical protein|nr:hypothetical protein [Kofleriaceae bacterium]